jgi:hypothetical protein
MCGVNDIIVPENNDNGAGSAPVRSIISVPVGSFYYRNIPTGGHIINHKTAAKKQVIINFTFQQVSSGTPFSTGKTNINTGMVMIVILIPCIQVIINVIPGGHVKIIPSSGFLKCAIAAVC